MDTSFFDESRFEHDDIRAVDAKFEAQKIAFAPLTFQAVAAMRNLGVLRALSDAGDDGATKTEIAKQCGISEYGAAVLLEMALGMNIAKRAKIANEKNAGANSKNCASGNNSEKCEKFTLGKIGYFLLEDDLTVANFNFANDVCYAGAARLEDSIRDGKPRGLLHFGENWKTIYEALSSLPEKAKASWFAFDHFYSSIAFPECLPIVFEKKPRTVCDIGGNTAKFALAACTFDSDVRMTIVDLPGQTRVAEKNAKDAGFANRIKTHACNMLDDETELPKNQDAFWMSQFLDCFSLSEVTKILQKIYRAANKHTQVFVLEPLWDKQKFLASMYSLQATSLYFTCMANGNSKMYRYAELVDAIEKADFHLTCAHHNLGSNNYSLLIFQKN